MRQLLLPDDRAKRGRPTGEVKRKWDGKQEPQLKLKTKWLARKISDMA